MNHICTWFCADEKGEESIFPQTGHKSSGRAHQDIYWKCITLFFATSKRFNKSEKHVFFTNVRELPVLNGKAISQIFKDLGVEVVYTDFKYKTPKGYFGMFQNQFYEFSILEYIVENNKKANDYYMILDSDCIFIKPAKEIFHLAREQGFLSFEDDCTEELVIHGLSRRDMKKLYEQLLGTRVPEVPGYHLGEFFMASVKNINIIFSDFENLWPDMIKRFHSGAAKFHEEAQTLSYIYYKNNFIASKSRSILKRIWTNPVFYRNVAPSDTDLIIWHLPAEKTYGLNDLYEILIQGSDNYGLGSNDEDYTNLVTATTGIPYMSAQMKLKYYIWSYYKALQKRVKKVAMLST